MPESINRYENDTIVDHLASNYVMGTLSARVRRQVEKQLQKAPFGKLQLRVAYWEQKLSPLDNVTPELQPYQTTWNQIETLTNPQKQQEDKTKSRFSLFGIQEVILHRIASLASIAALAIFVFILNLTPESKGDLSYIAVLSSNQQPQVIAATYGDTRELSLDIVELPPIQPDSDYELWVISKTDKIARSLGVISTQQAQLSRSLSEAEWRLIKDSDSLIITVEESGGSPFGEPSEDIVSRGLCIRMPNWKENA